jgi:hypothetical protein
MENNENNPMLNNTFEKICLQNDLIINALSSVD